MLGVRVRCKLASGLAKLEKTIRKGGGGGWGGRAHIHDLLYSLVEIRSFDITNKS